MPDILVCRADEKISENMKEKIALFCNVKKENVIENKTVSNLYEIPLMLEEEGLANAVCKKLNLKNTNSNNEGWEKLIKSIKENQNYKKVKIAIVGKYTKLEDSYLSVIESIKHAGYKNLVNTDIELVDSEQITKENVKDIIGKYNGIIVPGGFGDRGIEGMIETIKYARENKVPFLGICLGMQMAVIEFARNVLKLEDANSEEFEENCKNAVIHIMKEQKEIRKKGGTMRLGAYPCKLKKDSKAYNIYGKEEISERHRHRYEYNNKYRMEMEKAGLKIAGTSPDETLVEMVEIKNHPFFAACQFHPEFKSRPDKPHPLFVSFVKAQIFD